jgi:cardiolipin synthase
MRLKKQCAVDVEDDRMTAKKTRRIVTIPNILTMLRIMLVPVFIWAYFHRPGVLPVLILALSALTDVLDGKIARRFNQVSDVGKLLDPIADKLTQGAMLGCLLTRFPRFWIPFGLMVVREAFVGVTSLLAIKTSGHVEGAEVHGKVATVFLYVMVFSHLLFYNMPGTLSNALIAATTIVMAISFFLYAKKNLGIMRQAHRI